MSSLKCLHHLGRLRGLDHAALHDMAESRFGVESLARLTPGQVAELESDLSRPYAPMGPASTASGRDGDLWPTQEEKNWLLVHFYLLKEKANWTRKSLSGFIWTQTKNRVASIDKMTRAELNAVLPALRSIIKQKRLDLPEYTGKRRPRPPEADSARSPGTESPVGDRVAPPDNVVRVDFRKGARA